MKKSTIITVCIFVIAAFLLTAGFVLLTDNNISKDLFGTTTTTTTTTTTKTEPEYEAMDFFKEDVSKYVTLGQYTGMNVEVSMLEIPIDYIDKQIAVLLFQNSLYTKAESGEITDGVIFNFDYTGYINGVRFEGGSGTNTYAYIDGDDFITVTSSSTGQFIDGFAQGTLGASVGETVDVNVTFPEDYSQEDYAGKDAVFKVKINYICKTELTDEYAAKLSSDTYKTADSFKAYLKDYCEDSLQESNVAKLWEKIVENATFIEIPEQEFNYMFNVFQTQIKTLTAYGITYEQALTYYGFKDEDALKEYTNDVIKSELVVYAIMQTNSIDASDEEIAARLTELAKEAELTEEQYLEKYGNDYISQKIMMEKTDELILKSNTFVLATEK